MWNDERAQGLVEYALILILVILIVVVAVAFLGPLVMNSLQGLMNPTPVP